jgi:hypothetical protein
VKRRIAAALSRDSISLRFRGNGGLNFFAGVFLVATLLTANAFAQPKIASISPDWIQRGSSLEVKIAGEGLGSVTGFVFSGEAGLSATVIVESNPPPTVSVESASKGIVVAPSGGRDRNKSLRARLTAASDAPLGLRELRVLGSTGISEPLNITVGAVPEVAEVEPNNSVAQAQLVPVPSAIAGVIQSATEMDYFRFAGKKGEQLVLEVVAQRSGSPLDSSLSIFDSKGNELAHDEDSRGFDSLIEFTAPADGEYVAAIRDFQYRGGGDYKYRLSISALPFVEYIFPFGGQRGKPVEISVFGRNIEGAEKMTLNIDPNAPVGRQDIRLNTLRGLSNPIQFDVREFAEFMETEPNDDAAKPNAVTMPITVNGRIGKPKDVDRFRFKAAADGKVVCEVEARRFGSPLDALLAVRAGDSIIAQNDDAAGADARIEFDAKKDTDYAVSVRDLTDRGGEKFIYRLAIRPATAAIPTFAAKFFPDEVRLNRGGRTRIRCEVARQGFDGPVRFRVPDLPAGVSAEPMVIPAGRNEGDMIVSATPDALMGTVPLKVMATADMANKESTQPATPIALQQNGEKNFKQGFLSVFGMSPFTVDALTLAASMDQLKSGTVDVLVHRRPGFAGDIKLSAVGFSAGREAITKSFDVKEVTLKPDAPTAQLKFTAKVDSELGTRPILVRGEANDGGQTTVEFSPPVALTVLQIPFVLSAPGKVSLNAPRSGSTNVDEAELKLRVERRAFPGEIPLVLEGVPAGIRVSGTNVPANAAEALLTFVATDKAPPMTNTTVTIRGAAMHNDRLYRHKTTVKLSVSPPAIEIASTNATVAPK